MVCRTVFAEAESAAERSTPPAPGSVHIEAARHEAGHHILLIGHAGHPEVIGGNGTGTPIGAISLIETVADAETTPPPQKPLCLCDTDNPADDTAEIIVAQCARFTDIAAPHKEAFTAATTNQAAVKQIAPQVGCMLVTGHQFVKLATSG